VTVRAVKWTPKSSEEETKNVLKIAKNLAIENSSEDLDDELYNYNR
jgi:hypothetical protein|tara:strand:- start:305 stop:442 length:138 start_codon:yes stop_codon:yes gene_type:complete